MRLNVIIKKYRKERNLTQEQLANYLGVTPPAVNKWENGNSYPDITLLAPLARVLKIDVDTLLSFHDELTEAEMNQFIKDLSEIIQKDGYATGFEKAVQMLEEYPNCDLLRLHTAEILNAFLTLKKIEKPEKYQKLIIGWLEMVMTSEDEKIVSKATTVLVSYFMSRGDYDKAQQQLDKIPPASFDKQLTQAILFEKQSRIEEALEVYENIIYKNANGVSSILHMISHILCQEEKFEQAERYANLARDISILLELGDYNAYTSKFMLAVKMQDKEVTIEMLERMINGCETIYSYQNSFLYSHMHFNKTVNTDTITNMLKNSLKTSEELDFIRNEPKAQKLFNRL